ncbi:MAG: protein-L-isoaspartate(D-aspartate) O-methyltransferase [bacterium]|nr:protein-L-isoaspartate(D-aspartate) O-methyltransferase [bacterium]
MSASLLLGTVLGTVMIMVNGMGADASDGGGQDAERRTMVRQVEADVRRSPEVLGRETLSETVRAALLTVPRHEFVPHTFRNHAYENRALPIGLGQTISQPTVVAMMTDVLALAPTDTVLEVGTGSGYQAAVLAEVLTGGYVHTVEIVTELARMARMRLRVLGYDNVRVHEGDGYAGLPDLAPFDGIMVTAAAEEVPPALVAQLAPGGRLVMPLGEQHEVQWLTVLEKDERGEISRRVVLPVRFVPMTGEAERR